MKNIAYLTGLRGLAALIVVVGHCAQIAVERSAHPDIWPWWRTLIGFFSSLSVPSFIVLSGYVLAMPVVRDGTLEGGVIAFFTRRANRILPAYVFAVIASFAVAILITHEATIRAIFGSQFWATLFLMHDWIGHRPDWNRPLWSMPIEWHCYALAPVLYWAWRRFGVVRTSAVAAVLMLALMFIVSHAGFGWARLEFYVLFIAGGVAAQIVHSAKPTAKQIRDLPIWTPAALALLASYVVAVTNAGIKTFAYSPTWFELAWGAVMLASLIALREPNRLQSLLSSRPMVALGTISYSLYLLHWPIVDSVARIIQVASFLTILGIGLPLAMGAAALSYQLFEKPYLTRKERVTKFPTSIAGTVRLEPGFHC